MKKETIIWLVILIVAGGYLVMRAASGRMTHEYVRDVQVQAGGQTWITRASATPTEYRDAVRADSGQTTVHLSLPRTIGVWVAALLTLFIFSFLYRDNPLYKFAESVFIGVSAAYWMVVGFHNVIVPNLLGNLFPGFINATLMPGLSPTHSNAYWWVYFAPLILGVMLLWRLAPAGQWIARWPLALFIGIFAGLRLVQFIQADFLNQINNAIVPLVDMHPGSGGVGSGSSGATGFDTLGTLRNLIMVLGTLCCVSYFFFSFEHKGLVGKTARVGIWILMITFGAMFGYTVMGRITLFAARLEFLFDDWLWMYDPTGQRALSAAVPMLWVW